MNGPTRRDLLGSAAVVAGAEALALDGFAQATPGASGVVAFTLRRPEDLLTLDFEFRNAKVKTPWFGAPKLVPLDAAKPITAIVKFPSQHIDEQVDFESSAMEPPDPIPFWSAASGASRLCFSVAETEIELTADALLDWADWSPLLVPEVVSAEQVRAPDDAVTAIELPTRLVISGQADATWRHNRQPVARQDRTEIWHTRLTRTDGSKPQIRAVWTPDYVADPALDPPAWEPGLVPIRAKDRNGFVHSTHVSGFDPEPIDVDTLALSSAGGYLSLKKRWTESCDRAGYPIGWQQRTSLGRDTFTEVDLLAFAYPFGFKVSVVITSERKVQPSAGAGDVAFIRQHITVKFEELVRTYNDYRLPFVQLRPVHPETPYLDYPTAIPLPGSPTWDRGAFWPEVLGKPYPFEFEATDAAGRKTTFTAPLIIVPTLNGLACVGTPGGSAPVDSRLPGVQAEYRAHPERSVRPYFGQSLAFMAESAPMEATHPVQQLAFDGELVPLQSATTIESPFRPIIASAQIASATAAALGGADAGNVAWFTPANPAASKTEVYLLSDPVRGGVIDISFVGRGNRSGGVAAPRIAVGGYGRLNGPFGQSAPAAPGSAAPGAPSFLSDKFDPFQYLHADASIVGIQLASILKPALAGAAAAAPQILSVFQENEDSFPTLSQSFSWTTEALDDAPAIGIVAPIFLTQQGGTGLVPDTGAPTRFAMSAAAKVNFGGGAAVSATADGRLSNFAIQLAVLLKGDPTGVLLEIREAWFKAGSGGKTEFGIELLSARLIGELLEFIQRLEEELAPALGQLEQMIDVSPDGVRITLPPFDVPDISIGYLDLAGLTIGSSVSLPFVKRPPSFTFDFSSADDPFTVCVGIFAGGGFLSLTLDSNGIQAFSASFQFGGFKALSLGVVQGRVFLFGGIFYSSQRLDDGSPGSIVTFDAFVHAGGEASVFSIVTVSVDFYVALVNQQGPGVSELYGEVTLTYSIKVGFFSRSCSVNYVHIIQGSANTHGHALAGDIGRFIAASGNSRAPSSASSRFAGAPRPVNSLSDHLTRVEWMDYCEAFA